MWLLDDGALGDLARHVTPDGIWPSDLLALGETVAMSARADRSGRRQRWTAFQPALRVLRLMPDGPGYALLWGHLRVRHGCSAVHFGEHEAIALCHDHPHLIFVSRDKAAVYIALGELDRARVATAFDVWRDLLDRSLIDTTTYDKLCDTTARSDQGLPGVPRRFRTLP